MVLTIRELTPALKDDFVDVFENGSLSDQPEYGGAQICDCYCVYPHMPDWDALEAEEKAGGRSLRPCAERLIKGGTLHGYLAYVDGRAIGWCNANDKDAFTMFSRKNSPERWDDYAGKIKSIVCFLIAPGMRRKGVASAFLERVLGDAAKEGYNCVEAYPAKEKSDVWDGHQGPMQLYERFKFVVHSELENQIIVRKYL